ncbi:MAG: isocitrate/isopropylmalate dehydrogenase family protein [Candidatus Margulisbacteria bacterium]|nr:isocitrate/isopropylmalate dehydrogenase family protein [Candidatus Margulisiibacteriota bacterium]
MVKVKRQKSKVKSPVSALRASTGRQKSRLRSTSFDGQAKVSSKKGSNKIIETAKEKFAKLVEEQLARVERMKKGQNWVDYKSLKPIIIGICFGDGIGEEISKCAEEVLKHILQKEYNDKKVEFRDIKGLTIENRAKHNKAIPEDVLKEIKDCHVILKGPTTTPQAGDPWPNIESANVAMRKELDLFANVRPVKISADNIDWIFFRENTEGAYVLGSKGFDVSEDLSIDFKVITEQGAERIIKMAFEYAKNNNKKSVTVVTKSNVVKTTDGRFSRVAKRIAKEYEKYGIKAEEWYIDIMTAKLLDPARRSNFQVIVLPNLYGDILTDEAAQLQGGVGTAGSANIGKQWAMFEAIHGSAPRMVKEGRAKYADPSSMIRASAMLVRHIGFPERAEKIEMALDICGQYEKKLSITGRENGATGEEFTKYLLEWIDNPKLAEKWRGYVSQ